MLQFEIIFLYAMSTRRVHLCAAHNGCTKLDVHCNIQKFLCGARIADLRVCAACAVAAAPFACRPIGAASLVTKCTFFFFFFCMPPKMDASVSRRVGVLAQHLQGAAGSVSRGEVELQPVAASASTNACSSCGCNGSPQASTSYASVSDTPSSYAQVHGEVSRAPASWRSISTVAKEQLSEVRYEKAVGEGIAKVRAVRVAAAAVSGGETSRPAWPGMLASAHTARHACRSLLQITINRPEKRNAFTPRTGARACRSLLQWWGQPVLHCTAPGSIRETSWLKAFYKCMSWTSLHSSHPACAVTEMSLCFADARDDPAVGVVVLTGAGPLAFCSGGDQSVRSAAGGYVGADGVPRLNVLDLQMQVGVGGGDGEDEAEPHAACLELLMGPTSGPLVAPRPPTCPPARPPACMPQIRRLPKPVVAAVAGYAVGGGHILHMMCDITLAADNAVFGQTGPKVGSFDAGYGSSQASTCGVWPV